MNDPDLALRQFGERAGMSELSFDARGQIVFRAEPGRLVGMERADQEVLIYVAEPLDYDAGDWMMRACQRAFYGVAGEWPVQTALRDYDNSLHGLALTRIAEAEFTDVRLQQALDYLSHWLDALRNAV